MLKALFILFFTTPIYGIAQESNRLGLSSDLLTVINPDRPTINMNINYDITDNIEIEIGYGRRYLNVSFQAPYIPDTALIRFNGYMTNIELRLPSLFGLIPDEIYFGLSYAFISDHVNAEKHYYPDSGAESIAAVLDSYVYHRKINKFHLTVGFQLSENRLFTTQIAGQIGVKQKLILYSQNEFDPFTSITSEGTGSWEKPQNRIVPSAGISLYLNWKII